MKRKKRAGTGGRPGKPVKRIVEIEYPNGPKYKFKNLTSKDSLELGKEIVRANKITNGQQADPPEKPRWLNKKYKLNWRKIIINTIPALWGIIKEVPSLVDFFDKYL